MSNFEKNHTTSILEDPEVFLHDLEVQNDEKEVSPIPVVPQLGVALGLLVFVFGVTYLGASSALTKEKTIDVKVSTIPSVQEKAMARKVNAFADTSLEARSAFVWDVSAQRILFNKNGDDVRPLASITKLMTALVTYELLDPSDRVSITKNAIRVEGDSGLKEGESFTVENLVDLTLISSSNDGAAALGARAGQTIDAHEDPNAIFVHAMNVKAKELGMSKTRFENTSGLDVSATEAGAYGSARDIAMLMEYVVTHITDAVALTTLDLTTVRNVNGESHTTKNTNTYTGDIDGLIASKTGYTSLSGGNLVVAVNVGLNHPVVVVVLGSSQEGRFKDTLDLIERARVHVSNQAE
ncbi:D-alanyl-D-alanine carboxypeptidase [Candidatus Kaiserbacteria bacterium]|nr:MAG: D-alanyl-D-alanine carboxypeptidase [Candidatus Kaiserbacteria bacterium]